MNGVVILSVGSHRRQLLWDCIASVQRHNPELPVHVISDIPVDVPFTWVMPRDGHDTRYYKTQVATLSPFETTLFLDDDTVVHRPLPDFDEVLGTSDVAMECDSWWTTVEHACRSGASSGWCSRAESSYTANVVPGQARHHNTGVMFFRRSAAALFARWHAEWLKFQSVDQLSMCRAIHHTGTAIKRLGAEFNCRPGRPNAPDNPFIFHFCEKQRAKAYRRQSGLSGSPHQLYQHFSSAVEKGICSRHQYEAIGKIVHQMAPINMLVWGCGHDSSLWAALNPGGRTAFVESNPSYAELSRAAGLEVIDIEYPSRRGVPHEDIAPPDFIGESWDLVFVDAPRGAVHDSPGRELPFLFTSRIETNPVIVAHDCERPWEKMCYEKSIGEPDLFLYGRKAHYATMCFWFRGRQLTKTLLT